MPAPSSIGTVSSSAIGRATYNAPRTDDAMLVERIGYKVKMIEGSYNNIKITTKEDLNIGSQILNSID